MLTENSKNNEEKKDEKTIPVIGIIVSEIKPTKYYVWCKETSPGHDGILISKLPLQIGTWVTMKFSNEDFNKYFVHPPSNVPLFEVSNYCIMKSLFPTTLSARSITVC
ncbi:unnamed protein product [Caenorhabditis bovis]|uniref:Uncharacterized protein n=1 Tax=Caenorhabditis bovis TaxID=2654633 RepID=A0A8S1F5C4_9PELO|nr:unnamed protein product [Caenorhabditis bovis]